MTSYTKTHPNGTLRSPNSYFVRIWDNTRTQAIVNVFFSVPDVAYYELFVIKQKKANLKKSYVNNVFQKKPIEHFCAPHVYKSL